MLLKADQPAGNYWISSRPQYRVGSAAGYGVLRYAGANASALPGSPAPQPDTLAPWSLAQLAQVGPRSQVAAWVDTDAPGFTGRMAMIPLLSQPGLDPKACPDLDPDASPMLVSDISATCTAARQTGQRARRRAQPPPRAAQVRTSADLLGAGANRSLAAHLGPGGLSPPAAATRVLVLNNTQPLLPSGQLRWALNNVATYDAPSCLPALAQARPRALARPVAG